GYKDTPKTPPLFCPLTLISVCLYSPITALYFAPKLVIPPGGTPIFEAKHALFSNSKEQTRD
ncbi:MAG: hypothetical protein SH848_13080, partial [Saprospiraceae bacterium]|nr:hypothetical protein [Saprospiraceae bacterium]